MVWPKHLEIDIAEFFAGLTNEPTELELLKRDRINEIIIATADQVLSREQISFYQDKIRRIIAAATILELKEIF